MERLFFNPKRYDLGRVGRYKINQRLKVNVPQDHTVLTEDDFIAIVRYLLELSEMETAAVMGCGEGSVKTHLSRAMASLRHQLEAFEP